jgi:hypothetical protein
MDIVELHTLAVDRRPLSFQVIFIDMPSHWMLMFVLVVGWKHSYLLHQLDLMLRIPSTSFYLSDSHFLNSCKTAYAGHISVEYSIDKGNTWILLEYYYAWKYRQDTFFPIKLPIPLKGRTNSTRFRFIQKTFQADKDQWALDNVKVFHYFESGWEAEPEYVSNLKSTPSLIQFAQCCFDTEWCETRLSEDELQKCNKLPW